MQAQEGSALLADESVQRPTAGEPLHVHSVGHKAALALPLLVVCLLEIGEAPLAGDVDLLATSELEASSVESFLCVLDKLWLGSNGDEYLVDVDTGGLDVGLAEGLTHTLLESIGTSA